MAPRIFQCIVDEVVEAKEALLSASSDVEQYYNDLKTKADSIVGTDWVGYGSEEFYEELESRVKEAFDELMETLEKMANELDTTMTIVEDCDGQIKNIAEELRGIVDSILKF